MRLCLRLASTRAILGVIGVLLAALAVMTVVNPRLDDLPLPNFVAAATGAGAVAGIMGAIRPSNTARRYTGGSLMVVSFLHLLAFGIRINERTGNVGQFLSQSNALALYTLAFYFGFVVYARSYVPEGGK